ncbi:APC family permease [Actinomadura nitritigenes]|uniref:APC family permease n=1 Tax=Actinomadura nitritigenes TaxID=134602 RepID=A0ABS3QTG8_9ACTN|nr:APC family permease [Actinomadura nitritigenes]MBO2436927.1 APC family permease [Actinomadura nitritigenes]
MSTVDSIRPREGKFDGGAMGTADIVFFVLAGVAPMGVVVALLTLSIALGNGAGVPGTYLIAGVVLALFSAGYVRMSRRITNAGGFYTFARQGLGRRAGGATAYVALLAYNAATIGIFGALAYFGSEVISDIAGAHVSWQVCALAFFLVTAVLAYFEVTMSAKVLGVALAAEVLVLLGFDAAVLVHDGPRGFSLEVFEPAVVFGGGFGVSLMLAFGSFVGFEATALYGEEARDPHRTVPRATYLSLAVIAGFYLVTTWAAISAYGADHARAAAKADPENFIFNAGADQLGQTFADVMGILVMTSLFAAFLAFHCNTARYQVALARDGLLPGSMARIHARHGSPVVASTWQLGLVAAATLGFALAGQDPYLGMGISLYGLGVLGIVLLQAIAALSIVGFFLRHRRGESIWGAIAAPALGALGLAAGLVLMIVNYPTLTGSDLTWVNSLPWLMPAAAVAGAAMAGRRHGAEASDQDLAPNQPDLAAG